MLPTLATVPFLTLVLIFTNMSYAEGVKRFSVSAGWLHVMPQGKANP
ncbi:TPA: OmpW family protein, partial [Acinetobacter baumannii]